MRLTVELAAAAPQRMNPLLEREITLRGFKIGAIENTGCLRDQFDSVDLSDNEIKRLGNFAPSPRLKMLILHNNRVTGVDAGLGAALPNLASLLLTRNRVSSLEELKALAECGELTEVSLVDNPVCRMRHYRADLIPMLPQLKVIGAVRTAPRTTAPRRALPRRAPSHDARRGRTPSKERLRSSKTTRSERAPPKPGCLGRAGA